MKISQLLESKEVFQTGKPVTMEYTKNTEKAPYMGSTFGQDIEPAGEYMLQYDPTTQSRERNIDNPKWPWIYGKITFNNPLVISDNISTGPTGWKKDLSDEYNGLTGKKLSKALMKDGYDAIIIFDRKYDDTGEIVNLNGQKH